MFWTIFALVSLVKLLFINVYHSTDFEVHRNWLAITYSLPLSQWYTHDLSEWTLDYPPFFAYFEWSLSQLAQFVDPAMLDVTYLNYDSQATIVFQRLSVIAVDLVLALGVRSCLNAFFAQSPAASRTLVAAAILGNCGLLFVDHIHFQYNGFLFGILLLSIAAVRQERFLLAALLFAVLLHLKHIFMYMAPVYFVYLLRFYCLEGATKDWRKTAAGRLCKLGAVVLAVSVVSIGPFVQQLPQLLARLFPFKRGLCHAYWAPNFWALYNVADKAAAIVLCVPRAAAGVGNTGGLVQDIEHVVLPSVPASWTFLLSAVAMLPCLVKLWRMRYDRIELPLQFVRALVLCAGASFLFGWHVHEKAILMVFIPLSLLCVCDRIEAHYTIFLSIVAHYSLFPLLFASDLTIVKLTLFAVYNALLVCSLRALHGSPLLNRAELIYLGGFGALFAYENALQFVWRLDQRLPFLPLLMCSTYAALGVVYVWMRYYWRFLRMPTISRVSQKESGSKKKLKTK